MKKVMFLILLLLTNMSVNAQSNNDEKKQLNTDSINHLVVDLKYPDCIEFYSNFEYFYEADDAMESEGPLLPKEKVYVIGENKEKYMCTSYGYCFWINKKEIKLNADTVSMFLNNKCACYSRYIKLNAALKSLSDAQRLPKQIIDVWNTYPIIINESKLVKEDDYSTGYSFEISNNSKKTIKYVYLSIRGYNAVDDPVGNIINKKCIGPIEDKESSSYKFDFMWMTNIIEKVKIIGLKVQFMDNTYKIIQNPEKYIYPPLVKYDEMYRDKLKNCISVSKALGIE